MAHKYHIQISDDGLQKMKKTVNEILRVLNKRGIKRFRVLSQQTVEELNT